MTERPIFLWGINSILNNIWIVILNCSLQGVKVLTSAPNAEKNVEFQAYPLRTTCPAHLTSLIKFCEDLPIKSVVLKHSHHLLKIRSHPKFRVETQLTSAEVKQKRLDMMSVVSELLNSRTASAYLSTVVNKIWSWNPKVRLTYIIQSTQVFDYCFLPGSTAETNKSGIFHIGGYTFCCLHISVSICCRYWRILANTTRYLGSKPNYVKKSFT